MPLDRDTGAVKGFAYVEFASTESASKALDALNGKDVGGRNCRIGEWSRTLERNRRVSSFVNRKKPN